MHHIFHQQKVDEFSHPKKAKEIPFQNYLAKTTAHIRINSWLQTTIFAIVTLVGLSYTRDYSYHPGAL